ncbi:MAG: hypothetical protein J7484_14440 [Microbacterium sp.]|nr:hypothetical protein [Microbacterium sp.]
MLAPDEADPGHGATITRAYLQSAAFAAVQSVIVIGLAPLTPHLAGWFPPAYALVAGLQTLMIFASRRFTGLRWGATLTALLTALVCGPFTAIGWLMAVPLLGAGALFDAVLAMAERRGWSERRDALVAGAIIGTGLFLVSLPVMSLGHLGPVVVAATLGARILASWGGASLSARLVRRLERIGVRRARRMSPGERGVKEVA